jgi:hypothetical protein
MWDCVDVHLRRCAIELIATCVTLLAMFRLLTLLLIIWLPLQSIAAVASGHTLHAPTSMGGHHDGCASTVSDDVNDADTADADTADTHCAICHLAFVKALTSNHVHQDFTSTIHFLSAVVNQPPTVVSAVPEPIPLVS